MYTETSFQKGRQQFNQCIFGTIDWKEVYANCRTRNDYWLAFKGIINNGIYNFIPFVESRKPKCMPWLNNYLKHLLNKTTGNAQSL